MERVDCVVIGAGIVGLAVARALALAGREVIVLEGADAVGTETSSRNSEVIHAGIYYPAGSLKARLCVAGREALYRYCDEHGVPHRRCGKLLVATHERQIPKLAAIKQQADANGVTDLAPLTAAEAHALEPWFFEVLAGRLGAPGRLLPDVGFGQVHWKLLRWNPSRFELQVPWTLVTPALMANQLPIPSISVCLHSGA